MNFCNQYFHKYPLKNLVAPTHLCNHAHSLQLNLFLPNIAN